MKSKQHQREHILTGTCLSIHDSVLPDHLPHDSRNQRQRKHKPETCPCRCEGPGCTEPASPGCSLFTLTAALGDHVRPRLPRACANGPHLCRPHPCLVRFARERGCCIPSHGMLASLPIGLSLQISHYLWQLRTHRIREFKTCSKVARNCLTPGAKITRGYCQGGNTGLPGLIPVLFLRPSGRMCVRKTVNHGCLHLALEVQSPVLTKAR